MAPPNPTAVKQAPTNFADQPVALKVFILVFAITLIAMLYYFVLHMQLAEDIESAERRHAQLLTERNEAERRQQEFIRLSQELVDREPIDRRNRRILPENPEIPSFLGDMNRLAELSGLAIQSVQPEPEAPEAMYVRVPVRMRFQGRFHQFAKFFYAVSQLERAVNLHNIAMSVAQTAPRPVTPDGSVPEIPLSVELLASTFRRPTPPEAAPGAAPGAPP